MRNSFLGIAAILLAWLAYMASPYFALYRFANAIQERDLAAVQERIDFVELRSAIAGQIAAALRGKGDSSPLGQSGSRVLRATIDPFLEPFVTPEAITRLLSGAGQAGGASAGIPVSPDMFRSLGSAWAFFLASDFRGFRAFQASAPPERPSAERFRLIMRLKSTNWRIVGLDLPAAVRDRIVDSIKKGSAFEKANP